MRRKIPKLYIGFFWGTSIALLLGVIGCAMEIHNGLFGLSPLVYIYWCLAALSLLVTNSVAFYEWRKK